VPTGLRAHPPPGPPPLRRRRAPCMCMLCTSLRVARYKQCRDKHGEHSTLGSQHVCTVALVSPECVAPGSLHSGDTENCMSCMCTWFSCHVRARKYNQGDMYIGLEGRLTCSKSTLARGSLAFEACASPGVKNGGELSKHPSMRFYLAYRKCHKTMLSWGMKWATP
jgi:hypothetical protein